MTTPFTPSDLLLHERLAELNGCPARDVVACCLRSIDAAADANSGAIWMLPLDGAPPRPLTAGTSLDSTPRWSPDGSRLAFVSTRSGSPQIFLLPSDGGEARQLSHFNGGVVSMEWSPDGRTLCATCPVAVDPDWRGARAEGRDPQPSKDMEVVWRLPYKRDGMGYTLNQEVHLFTIDADSGDSRQLTDGAFEVKSAAWSHDGKRLVYARTREGRAAHQTDVWVCDADGGNARALTQQQPTAMQPLCSPDGRWVAFVGNGEEGDAQARPWLIDLASGEVQPLGDDGIEVLGEAGALHWARDSSHLVFVLAREGRREVATLSVPQGVLQRRVTGDRQVSALACAREHWVYVADTAADPGVLYASDCQGRGETRLGGFNAWWQQRTPLRLQSRRFQVPDGDGGSEEVQGWLLRAADAPPGPQPLLVDVHGGPASYAFLGYQFHAYWPALCALGWSVLALNAVGSSSFGRSFTSRLRGRWGELDLPQHLAAARALQHEGLADDRLAIAGKSYGGYMSAWAIGKTTDFRAAVVSAPVTNLETHFGTSDSGYYADPYSMVGEPFIDRETSRRLSPMNHADGASTPTLILQGKDDERCPKCQSEELFVTLMRGKEVAAEMVLYPGGDHHFFETGTPSHRVDAAQRLVDWLQRWIAVPQQGDLAEPAG